MSVDIAITQFNWDATINAAGQLVTAGSAAEVAQRVAIRLRRNLGEWFLNTTVGLPWYGDNGILGSNGAQVPAIGLLIRSTITQTAGVVSLASFQTVWSSQTRALTVYASIYTTFAGQAVPVTVSVGA
jgi:hypothetical protein